MKLEDSPKQHHIEHLFPTLGVQLLLIESKAIPNTGMVVYAIQTYPKKTRYRHSLYRSALVFARDANIFPCRMFNSA